VHNFFVGYHPWLFFGFLSGVILASPGGSFLGSIWSLFFLLALVFGYWGIVSSTRRIMVLPLGFFFLWLAVGFLLTVVARRSVEVMLPSPDERGFSSVPGVVVDEPDERDLDTRLTFRPDGSVGRLLLVVPIFPNYHYGDRLRVIGKPEAPPTFKTGEVGRTFDYPNYLAVRQIGIIIYRPKIERLEGRGGSLLIAKLFELKKAFIYRLDQVLPEPAASLLSGLVVGGKRSLGEVWQERLRYAGLIHLVVLSGYNLTIVGAAFASFFTTLRFRRSFALSGAVIAITLFSIMVGGGASVFRAAIMALIAILARLTGRLYEAGRALAVAIMVMVAINPLILVYDVGFQLSCLATLGLIYGSPLVEKWLKFIPLRFGLRSTITTTVAAQLAVLPWLLWAMGQVSPFALLANTLVVPIVPFAMLVAALIGFLGLFVFPLAYLLAPAGFLVATYILTITRIFAGLPGASLTIKFFPFTLVIIIYASYFFLWRHFQSRPPFPSGKLEIKSVS